MQARQRATAPMRPALFELAAKAASNSRRPASTLAFGFEALRQAKAATGAARQPLKLTKADCDFLRNADSAVREGVSFKWMDASNDAVKAVEKVLDRYRDPLRKIENPRTLLDRFTDSGYPSGSKTWPSAADRQASELLEAARPGSRHLLVGPDRQVLFGGRGRFIHQDKHVTVIQPSPTQFSVLCEMALWAGMVEMPGRSDAGDVRRFQQGDASLEMVMKEASACSLESRSFDTICDLNAACIYETPAAARQTLAAFCAALAHDGRLLVSVKSAGDRHGSGVDLTELLDFAAEARLAPHLLGFSHFMDWKAGGPVEQHVVREACTTSDVEVLRELARLDRQCALGSGEDVRGVARWTALLTPQAAPGRRGPT